jgi:hypothetical protein
MKLYGVAIFKSKQMQNIQNQCLFTIKNEDLGSIDNEIKLFIKYKYFKTRKDAKKYSQNLITKFVQSITIDDIINNRDVIDDAFSSQYWMFSEFQKQKVIPNINLPNTFCDIKPHLARLSNLEIYDIIANLDNIKIYKWYKEHFYALLLYSVKEIGIKHYTQYLDV